MDYQKDDEIDLMALLKTVFLARRYVLRITALFAIVGVVAALVSPVSYTATSTFMPQLSEGRSSSSLGGLASLAGINLSAVMGGQPQEIYPSLYPQITKSTPYRLSLLNEPVGPNDISTRDYILENARSPSVLSTIKKYTIGLPGLLFSSADNVDDNSENSLLTIHEEDRALFDYLDGVLTIEVDEKEGLVSLHAELDDRVVAARLAQAATDLLQRKVIAFKSQSARNNLDFIERQFESKRQEFEQIQDSIAIFKDQNLNITSTLYQNQLTRLESQFTVISSVFQELAGQVEQAKIQVNKDTPIFTIIEPVSVPLERTKPKRSLIVVVWTFLGGVLAVGWSLLKAPTKEIINAISS